MPLFFVWILEIIAFNLSLKRTWVALVLLAFALVINTVVYSRDYGYGSEELYLECEILYFFAAICLSTYILTDFTVVVNKDDKLFDEKKEIENIHPVVYSAFTFWLTCSLFYCYKLIRAEQSLWIEKMFVFIYFLLLLGIYKKHSWAFYLLFALLIYRSSSIIYLNTKYSPQFASMVLLLGNLYLLIGIIFQYFTVKNNNQGNINNKR